MLFVYTNRWREAKSNLKAHQWVGSRDQISVFTICIYSEDLSSFCSANTIRSLLHLQCTHRHTCWEPLPFPATTHTTQMSLTLNSGPISHLQWLTVNTGERPSFNRVYGGVSIVSPARVKLKSMLFGQKMFCISANMSDKICTVKDLLILSVPWHY